MFCIDCFLSINNYINVKIATHLNSIFDLEEIEESPDEADDEGCDHNEEEEVVVSQAVEFSVDGLGGRCTGHADNTKHLE